MAKAQPLTTEGLAKLGPDRLAALLLDAAEHDAALARTLRVAVASQAGATSAAAEIDVEIKRLKRGTSFIDRHRVPDFVRGLSALRDAIAGPLADADPEMALERIFDFIDLAPALIERTDDDGQIAEVMRLACASAAELAARAPHTFPSERSAFRAYRTYLCDDYGVADDIIAEFAQALDAAARAALREWIEGDLARLPPLADPDSATGRLGAWKLIFALAQIADAEGDVDAYCAAQQRLGPRVRDDAGMAQRLLDAGRAGEALAVIDAAEPNPAKNAIALADLQIACTDGTRPPRRSASATLARIHPRLARGTAARTATPSARFRRCRQRTGGDGFCRSLSRSSPGPRIPCPLAGSQAGGAPRRRPSRCARRGSLLESRASGRGAGSEGAARTHASLSQDDRIHPRSGPLDATATPPGTCTAAAGSPSRSTAGTGTLPTGIMWRRGGGTAARPASGAESPGRPSPTEPVSRANGLDNGSILADVT